jgi:hypothetical protein
LGDQKINIRISEWINAGDEWIYKGYPNIYRKISINILKRYPYISSMEDILGYLGISWDIPRYLFGANSQMIHTENCQFWNNHQSVGIASCPIRVLATVGIS